MFDNCFKGLGYFEADVSNETLDVTVGLDKAGAVNLEPHCVLGEVWGHIVTGHVDGTAKINDVIQSRDSRVISFLTDKLLPYVNQKGSIAVNGVSLTINEVDLKNQSCRFLVNLIPHTLTQTNLSNLTTESIVKY